MNKFLTRANKRASLGNAAALLIVISLIGQVLGFLRYKMINANFPPVGPQSTDAYFAAFKIPDFFFFTLAAGALGVASGREVTRSPNRAQFCGASFLASPGAGFSKVPARE